MKKRCCNIKNIHVKLFLENELILSSDYKATYEENNYLEYNDGNTVTHIDFVNNIISRKNDEFIFEVNINNKLINYTLIKEK